MTHAKTIEDFKAISLNVLHANMEITDQFYSILNDNQVHEKISSIGKPEKPKNVSDQDALALFQGLLNWKENHYLH